MERLCDNLKLTDWKPLTAKHLHVFNFLQTTSTLVGRWAVLCGTRESEQPFDPGVGGANITYSAVLLVTHGWRGSKKLCFSCFFRLPVMSDITSQLPEGTGTWRGRRLLTAVVLLSYCGCLAVEGYSVTTLSYHHSMLHQQRWAVMFYCNLITFFK